MRRTFGNVFKRLSATRSQHQGTGSRSKSPGHVAGPKLRRIGTEHQLTLNRKNIKRQSYFVWERSIRIFRMTEAKSPENIEKT